MDLAPADEEECVLRLARRLDQRPWEFGESGGIREVVGEVTGTAPPEEETEFMEKIFFRAVEKLRGATLTPEEQRLYDYYHERFLDEERPPIEEVERALKTLIPRKGRIRVAKRFLWYGIAMPVLTSSEKGVWDFIVERMQDLGHPPELSALREGLDLSDQELEEALATLKSIGFLMGDVRRESIALPRSFAGSIESRARGGFRTTFPDGRGVIGSCALNTLGAGFAAGQDTYTVRARDPVSEEKVTVRVAGGCISERQPGTIVVFAGNSCPNINFFSSRERLEDWREQHSEVEGEVMTLDEAFEYSKKVFDQHMHTEADH